MTVFRNHPIYLGTILLEPNRWPDRPETTYSRLRQVSGIVQGPPQVQASEWLTRAAADGFDGIELWENHALLCADAEFAQLCRPALPVTVYSSYSGLQDEDAPRRAVALAAVQALRAPGVKFNFGADSARRDEYLRNLRAWAGQLPPGVRMVCECHGGNLAETPEGAASLLGELADPRYQATVHLADRYMNRPLADWLRVLGPRVGHVHVGRVVEHGEAAVRAQLQSLRDHGFSGSFTIEFTTGIDWGKPQPSVETLYASAVADRQRLREWWES
jgi:sugar phosphate isomerase/epimerase